MISKHPTIATRKRARPPELDHLAEAFSLVGEKQEIVVDQKTLVLLMRFSGIPEVEKAEAEFERAQNAEEQFHKESYRPTRFLRVAVAL